MLRSSRLRIIIAAGGVLAALAMAAPAMASTTAPAAPAHATAKAGPLTSGYCLVNGEGWYATSNGGGAIMTSDTSCSTHITWHEQSNGSYEINTGDGCVNIGSDTHAYDNSCVANDSTEEFLVNLLANNTYALENVHTGDYLCGPGAGDEMFVTGAVNAESEWTW